MAHAVEPIESARSTDDRWDRIGAGVRRTAMCLLTAVVVVALCNVFGQRASTAHASSQQAQINLRAPSTVRPGLLYQAKITVTAKSVLRDAQLVLSSGWIDGLTLNTAEPSASTEHSGPNGSLVFDLGTLPPGGRWVQYLEYQVNPTSVSARNQVVTVWSDSQPVVELHRSMTIVP